MPDAKETIEKLLPEPGQRRLILHAFGEALNLARSFGEGRWRAYREGSKVRLVCGPLITTTIEGHRDDQKARLWLALDRRDLDKSAEFTTLLDNSRDWRWDDFSYPPNCRDPEKQGRYTKIPSRNGFYSPAGMHTGSWEVIKYLHFQLLRKAGAKLLTKNLPPDGSLLSYIDSEIAAFDAEEKEGGALDSAIERLALSSSSQGHAASVADRRAIEKRAMEVAETYFRERGWTEIRDVSMSRSDSHDLLCLRPGDVLHVEVKGTRSEGSKVLLTRGEVLKARRCHPKTALAVVRCIRLEGEESAREATGGQILVIQPWHPDDRCLSAIQYEYQVPH